MGILQIIGNTPLVEVNFPEVPEKIKILAKLEGQNPGGSVKDRPAYSMIRRALERGQITTETQLIEPTSGNTGIGLAMVAGIYGLKLELIMPENASKERMLTMEAFGAKVTLTPADRSMEGAIDTAREKLKAKNTFMLDQFGNPDNPLAHYETTGPEIWRDTEGKVTHFVSSMGTTGTITGAGRYFKENHAHVRIIGAQPAEGSSIPGIRRWPKEYIPKIFQSQYVDEIMEVSQEEATEMSRRLASEFGIFSGMSSGGSLTLARNSALSLPEDSEAVIVAIVCDRGDRYLSTPLFKED